MSSIMDNQPSKELTNADLARKNVEFAKRMLEAGDHRKAMRLLETAAEQLPDAETLCLLAKIELARPDLQRKALEHLKAAVVLAPLHTPSWLLLASYWGAHGQPDKQRRCLEKILASDPENAEARDALKLLPTGS
jgi:Tfp pilus assembly protein PilF